MKKNAKLFIVLTIFALTMFSSCGKKTIVTLNTDKIKTICNIAVLECYYHNTAKINKTTGAILSIDRTIWMDYDAKIKVGVDASKIDLKVEGNQVTVTMPRPKALHKPNINEDSFKFFTSEGEKTKITPEERLAAIEIANKEMQSSLDENQSIMSTAEQRTKKIIEGHISKIGKLSGKDYVIVWKTLNENE